MAEVDVGFETITPLYTGDLQSSIDKQKRARTLHASGLMGSLRWWYELIVRGIGGRACAPGQTSCEYDPKKPNHGLCDVCQVFGATGWARRFRLIVPGQNGLRLDTDHDAQIRADRSYEAPRGGRQVIPRYFPGQGLEGTGTLRLIATGPDDPADEKGTGPIFPVEVISGLLQVIARWGALGARPQLGYGVVRLTPQQSTDALRNRCGNLSGGDANGPLPSLRNAFFAEVTAPIMSEKEYVNLKYDLRNLPVLRQNDEARWRVMGKVRGNDRKGAKVMMSRPVKNRMRVWGWVPEKLPGVSRDEVATAIRDHLKSEYRLDYWREFDRQRDTAAGTWTDPKTFFESLL